MKIKVLCEGEKIIRKGWFEDDYVLKPNQILYDDIEFGWIENKTKHDLFNNNGKCAELTIEMEITKIRNKSRIKFLEIKNNLDNEEKKKNQLIEMNDWSNDDEMNFLNLSDEYKIAILDYENIKKILENNSKDRESFEKALIQIDPILKKYNI
jgi:hypothetical protein